MESEWLNIPQIYEMSRGKKSTKTKTNKRTEKSRK